MRSQQGSNQPSPPSEQSLLSGVISTNAPCFLYFVPPLWHCNQVHHYMVVRVINSLEEFNDIVRVIFFFFFSFSIILTRFSDFLLIEHFFLFFFFTKKIREPSSVVIEFCAGWCGPSQKINPTFDKCSEKYDGLSFYRVDIDSQPTIVQVARVQKVRPPPPPLFYS